MADPRRVDRATPGPSRPRRAARRAVLVIGLCLVPAAGQAQAIEQRGLAELILTGYAEPAPNDPTQGVAEALARYEATWRRGGWKLDGGIDARVDSHDLAERTAGVSYWDRTIQRPMFAVRRASGSWAHRFLTLEAGKQFVRWGKTDIVIPTDRFAPRDYLGIVNAEFLAVTAARAVFSGTANSLDVVFTPRMTPSRMPLLDQRWAGLPSAAAGLSITDDGATYPDRPQVGARWNRIGRYLEHSISVFRGFNHLPLLKVSRTVGPGGVAIRRTYPQLTAVGGDLAAPLPWFTVKAEAAWFGSESADADEFFLYVVQVERQSGEWLFIGGYAGEVVSRDRPSFQFAPDRGLAKALVGRASLAIDTNRALAFESVVRQDGDGAYAKVEYSQAIAAHWRVTAQAAVFGGEDDDYLGQYRDNSFASVTVRFNF